MNLKGIFSAWKGKKPRDQKEIDFDRKNMIICLCTMCPVQKDSICVQNKNKMLQISMKGMNPEPEDFPGMYCINGKAVCDDLDIYKKCNCINCEVWKENELELKGPRTKYCQNGKKE